MKRLLIGLVMLAAAGAAGGAQEAPAPVAVVKQPVRQWLYVLRPIPRLQNDSAWTPEDQRIVGAHFRRLQQLTADGVIVLAGRTMQPLDHRTLGLVIFEASTEAEARRIAEDDPAVKGGVMTVELFPYQVALQRK